MLSNIINVSGGKDSTATLLLAIERGVEFEAVFADTGNEHQITYDYLEYLEQKLGITIRRVKADFTKDFERKRAYILKHWPKEAQDRALPHFHQTGNPFLDLCIMKGRFPSTKVRFCTEYLKVLPIQEQVFWPLLRDGHTIHSWQGIRRDESGISAGDAREALRDVQPVFGAEHDERRGFFPNSRRAN